MPTYPKMKPKVKKGWLKRLRSSDYKQGKQRLRHAGRYCCLGVLMDELYPDGWTVANSGLRCNGVPNVEAMKKAGLYGTYELTTMNDGQGTGHRGAKDFKQIADWIEVNL